MLHIGVPNIGGRLENQDWYENDGDQDREVFGLYNTTEAFQPSISTLKRIIRGKLSALLSRMYVKRQHMYEDHVHGMSQNVFSSPVQIICEKGTKILIKNGIYLTGSFFNNTNDSFCSYLILFLLYFLCFWFNA